MQPHEKVERNRKQMALNNFIGGIMWALGVFIGSTIVVAIISMLFSKVDLIPVIGTFVAKITLYVQSNSQLLK